MATGKRAQQRAQLSNDIKATARRLMAEHGTAGVSLRMIARELEMTAPALYYYFPSYDALITALLVDTFGALADTLESARMHSSPDHGVRAVAQAYRTWALEHPIDFQLIYGNPIPGYVAPREQTVPLVVRAFATLTTAIEAALPAQQQPSSMLIPEATRAFLEAMRNDHGYPVSVEALHAANVLWSRIHGVVMLEIFQHLQPATGDIRVFYDAQISVFLRELGLSAD